MLAFSRIASFVLFVLSLSFLTCAAPTPLSNGLSVREGVRSDSDLLVAACVDLHAKIVARADVIVKLDDFVKIKADIALVIKDLKAYADLVVKIKVDKVDAKVQAEIAAHVLVILQAIVKICVSIIAKFGISVCLDIIASLQVALKLVIDNLDVCIVGFADVFVKLITDVQLKAIADVRLDAIVKLCLEVRAKLGLNVNLKVLGLVGVSL
ncbi:hypothetical protein RSOLAG22IIIB_06678 [Rhizoctonia solani]|uniref:Transmembrane protein n=1 Tax=Rhizoctonia solani TaxID=456999 RepID=A0A0K6GFG9_9AGAM|nr:hypothetical protein RSOLAG22IIIB_06678 [Rhizoctonia solani]